MEIALDHFSGCNVIPNGAIIHPNGLCYVYSAGGNVVVSDLTNPNKQTFLTRHDDFITCLTLSSKGTYIASGQRGDNANVVVWNFLTGNPIYIFEEHDRHVQDVAFSLDERILASLGCKDDDKLIFWDMSNGSIIASSHKLPTGTICLKHGGYMKDTRSYLLGSGRRRSAALAFGSF